jgi:hypothetical protein
MIGWVVLALGLPASQQPLVGGSVQQHLALPGHWLERGRIAADDRLLRESPLGLGGAAAKGGTISAAGCVAVGASVGLADSGGHVACRSDGGAGALARLPCLPYCRGRA